MCVCVTYICICICNVISLRNFVAAGVLAKYAEKTAENEGKRRIDAIEVDAKKKRCVRGFVRQSVKRAVIIIIIIIQKYTKKGRTRERTQK